MTKVGIVVQRFGPQIVGGAEAHALMLVNKFREQMGWDVDVFTTSASDYRSWKSDLPVGQDTYLGARIFRFAPDFQRKPTLMFISMFIIRLLRKLSSSFFLVSLVPRWLEWLWIVAQGPYAPKLIRSLKDKCDEYDAMIFFTYLYYPTIFGLRHAKQKSILVPTAHDELPFHFQSVGDLLREARFIAANTEAEADLLGRVHNVQQSKVRIVGLGFDPLEHGASPLVDRYILYMGRICCGKGVDQLIRYFLKYRSENVECKLKLVLAGKVEADIQIPTDSSILQVGYLDEKEKWRYLHHCALLANPSQHESLSMIAIEAMAANKPLLLSGHCDVFRYYEKVCPSVRTFEHFEDFSLHLRNFTNTDWTSVEGRQLLSTSREWALGQYSWPVVLQRYEEMIQLISGQ